MVESFLNSFLKYQLTFFSARWRLSTGRNGPAKAMVNNSGQIYFKSIYDITL